MRLPTRIYLTGFMGSGKSTLGPMIANVLGYDFLDLDTEIESEIGCSIADYFSSHGEEAFRLVEARRLRATADQSQMVIALGGGALAREDSLHFALERGLVVYLRWTAADLAQRLARSTGRPLLRNERGDLRSLEELREEVGRLLRERERTYLKADVCVDLDNRPVGLSVDAVVAAIRAWRRQNRDGWSPDHHAQR